MNFLPSRSGYKFTNSFNQLPRPSVSQFPQLPDLPESYGLCGGMSLGARQHFQQNRRIPATDAVPRSGTQLFNLLWSRQLTSFGRANYYVGQFIAWMALPDGTRLGVRKRSYDHFADIRADLNKKIPVVVGQVIVSAKTSAKVWENHQVLAYGYARGANGSAVINIYDPNFPLRDDITIRCTRITVATTLKREGFKMVTAPIYGFRCVQTVPGAKVPNRTIRGFFRINC
jgi:hypothetical protein